MKADLGFTKYLKQISGESPQERHHKTKDAEILDILSGKQNWTPRFPISLLPNYIRKFFIIEAVNLLEDMENNHLEIGTAPAPDPQHYDHKIKIVERQNPKRYSQLYREINGDPDEIKLHKVSKSRANNPEASSGKFSWQEIEPYKKRKRNHQHIFTRRICIETLKRIILGTDGKYCPSKGNNRHINDYRLKCIIWERLTQGYQAIDGFIHQPIDEVCKFLETGEYTDYSHLYFENQK